MPESPADLDAAVALLGDVAGRSVVDLGCTAPALGRRLLDEGAGGYAGLARDDAALAAAADELRGTPAELTAQDLDRWSGVGLGRFDAAVSLRALGRVRNLARLFDTLFHHLRPGGRLVFSVRHPVATAGAGRGYLDEDPAAGHRRFDTYVRELRYSGFGLDELAELGRDGRPEWLVVRGRRRD
jgi:SAM-dependent methyltransferase